MLLNNRFNDGYSREMKQLITTAPFHEISTFSKIVDGKCRKNQLIWLSWLGFLAESVEGSAIYYIAKQQCTIVSWFEEQRSWTSQWTHVCYCHYHTFTKLDKKLLDYAQYKASVSSFRATDHILLYIFLLLALVAFRLVRQTSVPKCMQPEILFRLRACRTQHTYIAYVCYVWHARSYICWVHSYSLGFKAISATSITVIQFKLRN